MPYKIAAVFLVLLGLFLGVGALLATGANTALKQGLALLIPTLAGLGFGLVWWRKSLRDW